MLRSHCPRGLPFANDVIGQKRADAVAAQVYERTAGVADGDTDPNHYFDIQITPGIYTNDFPYVTRPMTIEVDPRYPGKQAVLKATENLPNEKGIILTVACLTVNGLIFNGAKITDVLGGM